MRDVVSVAARELEVQSGGVGHKVAIRLDFDRNTAPPRVAPAQVHTHNPAKWLARKTKKGISKTTDGALARQRRVPAPDERLPPPRRGRTYRSSGAVRSTRVVP